MTRLRIRVHHPLPVAVASIAVAGLVGLLLAAAAGATVAETAEALSEGMFGSSYAIGVSLNTAAVLALVAAGFTVAHRAGLVNVGGEGQLCVGGIAATAVGTALGEGTPAPIAVTAVLLAAAGAGWSWAAIAAYLRVRRGTSEIITTLLLNFVGLALVLLMVHEPSLLRQPVTSSETLPQSAPLVESAHLPLLGIERSPGTIALWIAVVAVLIVGVVLRRTAVGVRLRSVGLNPDASARLGLPVGRLRFLSLSCAGAFSGLAGGILVATAPFVLVEGFSSGYGFSGLVVGLLARGSMLAVGAVSLLLGFLVSGGINLQLAAGVPASTVSIVESLMIILIAGAVLWTATGRRSRSAAAKTAKTHDVPDLAGAKQ
ncbi:ABC transporter permease [Rhodococcus opacus]|uniref:ABC transporter permease n=1 Tax=Rhodococcus opacus TaxID=37919 RepID=UPI002955418A|nr:ABC transporter permease [Rhodococcus opacus]MDV7083125.1 ABC transporter permease [Rhodococcus opacus]